MAVRERFRFSPIRRGSGHHACDDGRVIIGQQLRDYVHAHASIPQRGVPRAVVEAIATLVADAKIKAAWPDWDSTDSTTTWTCWIVTPEALGYVRVEYGMPLYDERADREHKLTPSSQSAWSRPLTDVIQLRWGAVHEAQAQHDTYYPAEPITVTFSDGETTIPEGDFPVEQCAKADQVLAAIRAGVNFGNLYNSRRG
jgi:hypothetical protein